MARYIDADALMEDLRIVKPITETEAVAFRFAYCKVKDAPTADVRENVHAKWLREPNCFYRCSECGKHYPSICDNMDFRICPNCGAEMCE